MRDKAMPIILIVLLIVFGGVVYSRFIKQDEQPANNQVIKTAPAELSKADSSALAKARSAAPVGQPLSQAKQQLGNTQGVELVKTLNQGGRQLYFYRVDTTNVVVIGKDGRVKDTALFTMGSDPNNQR